MNSSVMEIYGSQYLKCKHDPMTNILWQSSLWCPWGRGIIVVLQLLLSSLHCYLPHSPVCTYYRWVNIVWCLDSDHFLSLPFSYLPLAFKRLWTHTCTTHICTHFLFRKDLFFWIHWWLRNSGKKLGKRYLMG